MWKRNLLFIGLVLGGAAALAAGLFPRDAASGPRPPAGLPAPTREVREVVAKVDAELHRAWSERKLTPAPKAPELAVVRRLSLALTGTIPSLEELRQIEARPAGTRADWWLDRTFQDRRYADNVAERLARAFVGVEDGPFVVFRRRRFVTWLGDALTQNRPYDAVVRDLIADSGIWTDRPATNFVSVVFDQEKKEPDAERLAGRVARAFLGVRLDCAQCHNHPFQPWKQQDFQGLAAFFAQVHSGFSGIHDGEGEFKSTDRKTGKEYTVAPRVPFHADLVPKEGTRRERLARWATDPRNPSLARATANRVWALMFGRPLVDPVDDVASAGEVPRVLDLLADDFAAHGYNLRRLIRAIAATEAFRLDSVAEPSVTDAHEEAWAAFPLTRLRPDQVAGALLQTASLDTLDARRHVLARAIATTQFYDFIKRHGDTGEDEFSNRGGTIPQRLLLMNGDLVQEKTKDGLFNASSRIAVLAPTDRKAVETAYLTILTRRPTAEETAHFAAGLDKTHRSARKDRMADLSWTLLNATEFSWNH